jgi:hypothetical protein
MIRFGPGKDIDLSIAGKDLNRRYRPELLAQNERSRGLWRRLHKQEEPGVLLADEVGKGKTYIALALAFAQLATRSTGRVLVLTHSWKMARVWSDRWKELAPCVSNRWRHKWDDNKWSTHLYSSFDQFIDDARRKKLPQISFASYELLKKYGSDTRDAGYLLHALGRAEQLIGLRLRSEEKRELIKDFVECDLRSVQGKALSITNAKTILSFLDHKTRWWRDDAYHALEDVLDKVQARSHFKHVPSFDLLIVDEAHKLEGTMRHRVVARLLHKRFKKCVLVTATPFALNVNQFRRRLLDFCHAYGAPASFEDSIGKLPLDDFSKAVDRGATFQERTILSGNFASIWCAPLGIISERGIELIGAGKLHSRLSYRRCSWKE